LILFIINDLLNTVPQFLSKHLTTIIFLFFCTQLYYFSILIAKTDSNFNYRWLSFWLHLIAVFSIFIFYIKNSVSKRHLQKIHHQDILIFGIIFIFVEAISFFNIPNYPFVSVGDELRDGGLNAMEIDNGTIKNIFEYGSYDAHGLIIPAITSLSYRIFGGSVLTYRIPATIFACFDAILIFTILKLLISQTTAIFGTLILITLPLHLFFARTQIVVSLNSFLSSLIILALFFLLKKGRSLDYVLMGTIIGFAFGFHAAIRVIAILVLLAIIAIDSSKIIEQLINKKNEIQKKLLNITLLTFFCFIGFGPRLLFTNPTNFFHTSRLVLQEETPLIRLSQDTSALDTIKQNYVKSLMVWFYEPTHSFFPDEKPILPPLLALFFILGIGYSLFILKNTFLYILIYLAIVTPLFSSALTDQINSDHRLSPLLPIGAIFVSIGISYIFSFIHHKYLRYIFWILTIGYLIFQTWKFFAYRLADKNYEMKDYLSMHLIQFIKSSPIPDSLCLFVSPTNYENLNFDHYIEQYRYFLPNTIVQTVSDEKISDSEAYLINGTCPENYEGATKQKNIPCTTASNKYYCPENFDGNITIHFQ